MIYAQRFASPPAGFPGIFVVTSNRGLLPADLPITLGELKSFGTVDIDPANPLYARPLGRDLQKVSDLAEKLKEDFGLLLKVMKKPAKKRKAGV